LRVAGKGKDLRRRRCRTSAATDRRGGDDGHHTYLPRARR
jgi:hypothetical protein